MMRLAFLCAETSEATHQGGCSEKHLPVAFILKALERDQKETPAVLTESDRAASVACSQGYIPEKDPYKVKVCTSAS